MTTFTLPPGESGAQQWLSKALHGQEWLPFSESGEPTDLAIHRLFRGTDPATQLALRTALTALVTDWVASPSGEDAPTIALLDLVVTWDDDKAKRALRTLAPDFPPSLTPRVRLGVLHALHGQEEPAFWLETAEKDPYVAPACLGGVVGSPRAHAGDPVYWQAAVSILRLMPDTDRDCYATRIYMEHSLEDCSMSARPQVREWLGVLAQQDLESNMGIMLRDLLDGR